MMTRMNVERGKNMHTHRAHTQLLRFVSLYFITRRPLLFLLFLYCARAAYISIFFVLFRAILLLLILNIHARLPLHLSSPINWIETERNCANGFSNYVLCLICQSRAYMCVCVDMFPFSMYCMTCRSFFAYLPHIILHIFAISSFVVCAAVSAQREHIGISSFLYKKRFVYCHRCLGCCLCPSTTSLHRKAQTKYVKVLHKTQCNNCNIVCSQFLNHKKIIIFLILFPYRARTAATTNKNKT